MVSTSGSVARAIATGSEATVVAVGSGCVRTCALAVGRGRGVAVAVGGFAVAFADTLAAGLFATVAAPLGVRVGRGVLVDCGVFVGAAARSSITSRGGSSTERASIPCTAPFGSMWMLVSPFWPAASTRCFTASPPLPQPSAPKS